MEGTVLMEAHVQLKRMYTALNECVDLTRQLADAVDRRDEVAMQLLVSMREEPVRKLRRSRSALEHQRDALEPEEGRQLAALLNGEGAKEDAEIPLTQQAERNARLLRQLQELDKAVSLKMSRDKSVYQ